MFMVGGAVVGVFQVRRRPRSPSYLPAQCRPAPQAACFAPRSANEDRQGLACAAALELPPPDACGRLTADADDEYIVRVF